MRKLMLVLAAVACLGVTGCGKTITLSNSFDPTEAQQALAPGNNTIKGSAVILRNDGVGVTCAGRRVELIPVTAYSSERIQHIYGNTEKGYVSAGLGQRVTKITNDNPAYQTQGKKIVTGDAQGFFTFSNVKDGEYFITSIITWQVSPYFPEGGALMQRVRVSGGQTVEIVLSPHN